MYDECGERPARARGGACEGCMTGRGKFGIASSHSGSNPNQVGKSARGFDAEAVIGNETSLVRPEQALDVQVVACQGRKVRKTRPPCLVKGIDA